MNTTKLMVDSLLKISKDNVEFDKTRLRCLEVNRNNLNGIELVTNLKRTLRRKIGVEHEENDILKIKDQE